MILYEDFSIKNKNMLDPNNTNTENTDNYYDLDKDHGVDFDISPDQLNLFEENESEKIDFDIDDATYMDITHKNNAEVNKVVSPIDGNLEEEDDDEEIDEDEVTPSTKLKIIATLIIVGLAGYAAYWVQEPVQIKADVLGSDIESKTNSEENLASNTLLGVNDKESTKLADSSLQNSISVDMSAFGFEPATLNIAPGTTVVWTNTSSEDQTIVGSSDNGESFVSPVLSSGDSFNYTFENSDNFEYYSTFNPTKKANIIVKNSADNSFMQDDLAAFPDAFEFVDDESSPFEENLKPSAEVNPVLINDNELKTNNLINEDSEELRPVADENTPNNLAKTGPAETLYAFILFVSLWINRKKLTKVFNK